MPISDLTGCVWVSTTDSLSETMTANYNNPYLINFTYNNDTYDSMFEDAGYRLAFSKNNVAIFVYDWDEGFWLDTPPITLTFTGGTDATNSDLIEWLQDNGTLTAPIVANTYELTHTLTNVSKGNTKFTITADTGYVLPSSVSVSNGTLVSYDSTTGEVVVSGDNAVIIAECVATMPSGDAVEIALTYYMNGTHTKFKFEYSTDNVNWQTHYSPYYDGQTGETLSITSSTGHIYFRNPKYSIYDGEYEDWHSTYITARYETSTSSMPTPSWSWNTGTDWSTGTVSLSVPSGGTRYIAIYLNYDY